MLEGILFLVREPMISVAPPESMKAPGAIAPAPIIAHMPSIEPTMTGVPAANFVSLAASTDTKPAIANAESIVGNKSPDTFTEASVSFDQDFLRTSTAPVHQASRKSVLASPVSFKLMKSLAPRHIRVRLKTFGSFLRNQISFASGRVGKKQNGSPTRFLTLRRPILEIIS